ncbi:MAG: TlpA family protein disulfide reductase [Paenibacillaceae bacterium]|jgi:thiol-disulfide isomerase/thioredoxin|nr:TlpA family protein disulfide reductase [Paenibacillaceae bacterium]
MNRLRNKGVWLIAALLAGWTVVHNMRPDEKVVMAPLPEKPALGYLAPSFQLPGMDGSLYSVGGIRKKPLFLNYWASWCAPCKEEAPILARLYEKYKDQLDVYAVNVTGNDELEDARQFVERYGFTFPVLLDYNLLTGELYQYQGIPTSFLIDRNGTIVDIINLLEPSELDKKLKELING